MMNKRDPKPNYGRLIDMKTIGLLIIVSIAIALFFAIGPSNTSLTEPESARLELKREMLKVVEQSKPAWQHDIRPLPVGSSSVSPRFVANTTYRPGTTRPVKVTAGDMYSEENLKGKTRWWLLAHNNEEAKWLDYYGYPTVAEEERLDSASDADLDALIANGDRNAKAHQVIRAAKRALVSPQTARDSIVAANTMESLLATDGPYQAYTIARGFGEMLKMYQDLPTEQRTEDIRKTLRTYDLCSQMAFALGKAYGDSTYDFTYKTMRFMSDDVENGIRIREISALQVMPALAAGASYRASAGLPPLTILSRPDGRSSTGQIIERY